MGMRVVRDVVGLVVQLISPFIYDSVGYSESSLLLLCTNSHTNVCRVRLNRDNRSTHLINRRVGSRHIRVRHGTVTKYLPHISFTASTHSNPTRIGVQISENSTANLNSKGNVRSLSNAIIFLLRRGSHDTNLT